MGLIVFDFLDFFFTFIAAGSAFLCLYMLRNVMHKCDDMEVELRTLKHPINKIHVDIVSLRNHNKRTIGKKNG